MSEQTVEAPSIQAPVTHEQVAAAPVARRLSLFSTVSRYPWLLVAAALLAISTVIVLWARVRPGYDPYGWLVWGHQTLQWNLDTNGAPSWKPLPYLFTVPYAVVGHYALWLWMITSTAISLSAVVFAARIAYRLTGVTRGREYAGMAAAVFAGGAVLGIRDYSHFILSAQSDAMIVGLCLGAIDCHLSKRPRWAFAMLVLASLGRPEAWPFLGLYGLWAWRTIPSMRKLVMIGFALQPVLWFGIPLFTAKSPFVAGSLAQNSPRQLHGSKIYGTLDRFLDLHELPVQLASLVMVGLALYRRDLRILVLAAAVVIWTVVEAGFALHGWPAVPRYLFEPVAVMAVLAGVLVGRVLMDLPSVVARLGGAGRLGRTGPLGGLGRWATPAGSWAAILVVGLLCVSMLPATAARIRVERKDLTHERARGTQINRLQGLIAHLGGAAHILSCGSATSPIEYQSILAWSLGENVGRAYYAGPNIKAREPVVYFFPHRKGWITRTRFTTAANQARCHSLNAHSALS